ncbi:hypothetical protein VNO77_02688 [Canavalia gladiata]|uniref:Uncharacterized protein n=1 Tax=Canavalia gladiata TaxID=3824 RepID=A0AAN9R7G1_CANGL
MGFEVGAMRWPAKSLTTETVHIGCFLLVLHLHTWRSFAFPGESSRWDSRSLPLPLPSSCTYPARESSSPLPDGVEELQRVPWSLEGIPRAERGSLFPSIGADHARVPFGPLVSDDARLSSSLLVRSGRCLHASDS